MIWRCLKLEFQHRMSGCTILGVGGIGLEYCLPFLVYMCDREPPIPYHVYTGRWTLALTRTASIAWLHFCFLDSWWSLVWAILQIGVWGLASFVWHGGQIGKRGRNLSPDFSGTGATDKRYRTELIIRLENIGLSYYLCFHKGGGEVIGVGMRCKYPNFL